MFSSLVEFITAHSESDVGAERAMGLRKELLDLGVIDIVLLCLAQYAQQAPRCASLHAEDKGKSSGNTSSVCSRWTMQFSCLLKACRDLPFRLTLLPSSSRPSSPSRAPTSETSPSTAVWLALSSSTAFRRRSLRRRRSSSLHTRLAITGRRAPATAPAARRALGTPSRPPLSCARTNPSWRRCST